MGIQRIQSELVEELRLPPDGAFVVTNDVGRELFRIDADQRTGPPVRVEGATVSRSTGGSGAHPGLAAHESLGLVDDQDARLANARPPIAHSHPYADVDHGHTLVDADIPAAIARDAEVTAAIATHLTAAQHGAAAPELYAVGDLYLTTRQGNPAALLGYGTWASFGAGRVLIGADTGQAAGDLLGSATHGHAVTQPADHAALSHAGATVGNHTVTQPSAHADHAAQAHSAHAGATVGNHAFTQPSAHSNHTFTQPGNHAFTQPGAHSNHSFTQPANHSAHVVTQPSAHADVLNHVHLEQLQGGTTGTTTGTHLMGSAATGGSLRSAGQSTLNPTSGGVASQAHSGAAVDAHSAHSGGAVDAHSAHSGGAVDAHSGGAVDAHSAHSGGAVDAHTVGQASAHTDHPALSHGAHTGTGVDAHTVGQATQHAAQSHTGVAVAAGASLPPAIVAYIWQRTA